VVKGIADYFVTNCREKTPCSEIPKGFEANGFLRMMVRLPTESISACSGYLS